MGGNPRKTLPLAAVLALCACADVPRTAEDMQTGGAATTTVSPKFDREKRRLAILPFAGAQGLNYYVPEKLAAKFAGMGFDVTGPVPAEKAVAELRLDPSRPISPEYLARAAELLGADYVMTGAVLYASEPGGELRVDEHGAYAGGGEKSARPDGQSVRIADGATGETVLSSFCCGRGYYGVSVAAEIAESVSRALFPERYKTSFRP